MRLIHYSDHHLTKVNSVSQSVDEMKSRGHRGDKPRGLWVSVEGDQDWPTWCTGEGFALQRLTHRTEIILQPKARMLHLGNVEEILAFHAEYGCSPWYAEEMAAHSSPAVHGHASRLEGYAVKWAEVASIYDGIVIAPYAWKLRLDHRVPWYYTWDCASGCIWNAGVIKELRPLPVVVVEEKMEDAQS